MTCGKESCRNGCCCPKDGPFWNVPDGRKYYRKIRDPCCISSSSPESLSSCGSSLWKDRSSQCEDIHRTCSVDISLASSTEKPCGRRKKDKIHAAGKRKKRNDECTEPIHLDKSKRKCVKCKKEKCECKRNKGYVIRCASKRGHPWECNIHEKDAKVWAVQGKGGKVKKGATIHVKKGATIHVKRGETYNFYINPGQEELLGAPEFYFSRGPGDDLNCLLPGGKTSYGKLTVCFDDRFPSRLFYQSTQGLYRGGEVVVSE